MQTPIVTAIISGAFAIAGALGSVWLKHYLETRRDASAAHAPEVPLPSRWHPSETLRRNIGRPAVILISGLVLGALSDIADRPIGGRRYELAWVPMLVLCGVCLRFVLVNRRLVKGLWTYQLDVLILWAASLTGFSASHGGIWSDAVGFHLGAWILAAVLGGGIILIAGRHHGFADRQREQTTSGV
ncbi:MAG TPA: hypothetical protein P5525_08740, partial [Candidatus Paceibacterota bacterium]|nr:hypothetical protein [Candidatus Paceibacterota bacterium]